MTGRPIVPPSRGLGRDRQSKAVNFFRDDLKKRDAISTAELASCGVKVVLHDGIFFSITPCLLKVPTNVIQSLYL